MNGVGGKRTATGSAEKKAKMGGHWAQGGGKEENGWRQEGARNADGSAEKRAKMNGVATQWAPARNEWRIQTHQAYGASRADTGRPDEDAIRRMHIFFFLMKLGTRCSMVPDLWRAISFTRAIRICTKYNTTICTNIPLGSSICGQYATYITSRFRFTSS